MAMVRLGFGLSLIDWNAEQILIRAFSLSLRVCVCVWGGVQKNKGRHQEVRVRVELRFPAPSREARSLHRELSRVVLFVCFVFLGFGVQRVLGFFEFRV